MTGLAIENFAEKTRRWVIGPRAAPQVAPERFALGQRFPDRRLIGAQSGFPEVVRAKPDGTFETGALPPGEYVLTAMSIPKSFDPEEAFASMKKGRARITVGTTDVEGVTVRLDPGAQVPLHGHVTSSSGHLDYSKLLVATMMDEAVNGDDLMTSCGRGLAAEQHVSMVRLTMLQIGDWVKTHGRFFPLALHCFVFFPERSPSDRIGGGIVFPQSDNAPTIQDCVARKVG